MCNVYKGIYVDKVEVVNVVSETITSPMDRGVVPPNQETVCTHSFKLLKQHKIIKIPSCGVLKVGTMHPENVKILKKLYQNRAQCGLGEQLSIKNHHNTSSYLSQYSVMSQKISWTVIIRDGILRTLF